MPFVGVTTSTDPCPQKKVGEFVSLRKVHLEDPMRLRTDQDSADYPAPAESAAQPLFRRSPPVYRLVDGYLNIRIAGRFLMATSISDLIIDGGWTANWCMAG